MKMNSVVIASVLLGAAVVLSCLGACPAYGAQVRVDAAMGSASILANTRQTAYLRVALTGPKAEAVETRPPVNVALVLDKSGSMSGEKLAKAKEAAIMVIDRLQPNDIVSVVAYDSMATVLTPATKATDRFAIQAAIQSLEAGSNTALFAGVSKGAMEMRKFLDEGRINRIILLSDGIANEGPSSPGALGELGASLIREGISVSTIGLGLDYNEDLMTALARKSDGNHMFAEKAQDLMTAFDRDFGDMVSVVAKNVSITIRCEPGVRPVRALGREVSISGQNVYAGLNQIYADQTKYVLIEVELDPARDGMLLPVAQIDVAYADMATRAPDAVHHALSVHTTLSPERVAAEENRDVKEAVIYQISAERNVMAMRLRDEGKVEEGRQVLQQNLQYLEAQGSKDSTWYNENAVQMQEIDKSDADWRKTRKSMMKGQYEIKQQMKQ